MSDVGRLLLEVKDKPTAFARGLLTILNADMRIVPFVHSPAQRHYLKHRTGRDLILKARQLGFSTVIQGELFRYCVTRPVRVTTIGKDDENTSDLRVIFNRFYEQLPDDFRPSRDIANATTTEFKGVGSRAVIRKAGNTTAGRGGTNFAMHFSEIAFYRDATEIIRGATQAGNPSWIVCESTPNGEQGWFYDACMRAYHAPDDSAWRLHFYPWWWDVRYVRPLPDGAHEQDMVYADDELALVSSHGLSAQQIMWRREKVREIGRAAFIQEYPEDVVECFRKGGGGVFTHLDGVLDRNAAPSPYEGRFVAGVDWGREDDYTALSIWDYDTNEEVFIDRWKAPLSYAQIRQRIIRACVEWGVGVLWVEGNSMGANVEELQNDIDEAGLHDRIALNVLMMTNKRKALMVDGLRNDMERKTVLLLDVEYATREMRSFTESTTALGAPVYSHPNTDGAHDDCVDARLIAWQACQRPYG